MKSAGDRPYGELLQDPEVVPPAAAAGAIAGGAARAGAITAAGGSAPAAVAGSAGGDVEWEEAIAATWESKDPSEVGIFEHLATTKPGSVNYQTEGTRWSALMVVAGSRQNGAAETAHLLELGVAPALQDGDGWTALHWAAFHGCAPAAAAICDAFGEQAGGGEGADSGPRGKKKKAVPRVGTLAQLRSLLELASADGRTALSVAEAEGNEAVAAALRAAATRCGANVSGSKHRPSASEHAGRTSNGANGASKPTASAVAVPTTARAAPVAAAPDQRARSCSRSAPGEEERVAAAVDADTDPAPLAQPVVQEADADADATAGESVAAAAGSPGGGARQRAGRRAARI
jgi:hypothetical protein